MEDKKTRCTSIAANSLLSLAMFHFMLSHVHQYQPVFFFQLTRKPRRRLSGIHLPFSYPLEAREPEVQRIECTEGRVWIGKSSRCSFRFTPSLTKWCLFFAKGRERRRKKRGKKVVPELWEFSSLAKLHRWTLQPAQFFHVGLTVYYVLFVRVVLKNRFMILFDANKYGHSIRIYRFSVSISRR